MKNNFFILFIVLGLLFSFVNAKKMDDKQILNEAKICVAKYDNCLSDFFQGLGSMSGDEIEDCQNSRDECLSLINKKEE
ncbi:MAG: hypothetical protein DRG11_05825 [Epsilonproteobacteria bacterium]|nr:MAG: hypothetical protein DRG11_05825 [Campylobacterota bacterium]